MASRVASPFVLIRQPTRPRERSLLRLPHPVLNPLPNAPIVSARWQPRSQFEQTRLDKLKKLIMELLEIDDGKVVPEASFVDDFGADSLDFIELITAVEDTFGIEIPDEDAEKMTTVQNAVEYINSKT